MHLIIYFNGTGDNGASFGNGTNDYVANRGVMTIQVEGCHAKEVCNAGLFPDLPAFAKRFTNRLFNRHENGKLTLTETRDGLRKLKIGIQSAHDGSDAMNVGFDIDDREARALEVAPDKTNDITGITLCGYSRGAVTCFNVAKELNKIAPHIPVDIVANQPVPGNSYQGPGTNAASVADCSHLQNVRNVSIILGAYTGNTGDDLHKNDKIHRGFFSQIIPKLPNRKNVKRELIVIPKQHHNVFHQNNPFGTEHLHMQIAKYLSEKDYVTKEVAEAKKKEAKDSYGKTPHIIMPQTSTLQSFFGLKRKEAYRHIDKLHPSPLLRSGMEFDPKKSLLDWWKTHDKSSSRISSKSTKQLVEKIKSTDKTDMQALIALYEEADKWLILKDGSASSRYYQVMALRDNIHHVLVNDHKLAASQLHEINYKNIHENHHFLNHWKNLSAAASHFKTDATRTLDRAFLSHSKAKLSQESDETLLRALDDWLEKKEGSNSKRYDLVVQIREDLTDIIRKKYSPAVESDINSSNKF